MTSYEVIAAAPESVRGDLCRLWSENLHLAGSAEAHFRWLYREAVEPASTVFVLQVVEAGGGRHIVGANGYGIRRFQLGPDANGLAAVSGDLAVTRDHRSLQPALRLVRAVREAVHDQFDLCYGFPNAKAEGVMVHAGFHVLGKTTRYARVLRHATYLPTIATRISSSIARLIDHPRLARPLAALLDVARLTAATPQQAKARARYRLTWLEHFDARFDDLWVRARGEYDVVGHRTATFLGWRYPRCEIAALQRITDGTLVAYAIVERELATGAAHLRDLFGHQRDLDGLLALLVPSLWWRGATSVSVRLLGAPHVVERLLAHGFEPRAEQRTVLLQVGAAQEHAAARLHDPRAWHLFDLDEDV